MVPRLRDSRVLVSWPRGRLSRNLGTIFSPVHVHVEARETKSRSHTKLVINVEQMLPRPLQSTVQQAVGSTSLGPSLLSENYGREKYVQGQSSETRKKENDLKILSNVKALFEILKRVEDGDAFEHSRAIVRKANRYNYHCANRGGFKRGLPVRPRN